MKNIFNIFNFFKKKNKHNLNQNKNFLSKTDPQGSYTGNSTTNDTPVQDADDL